MASLAERIARAKAEAESAESRVKGEDFIAEEAARKELDELQSRKAAAERRELDMLVARMLDDAPDGAEAVVIEARLPLPLPEMAPRDGVARLPTILDSLPREPLSHVFLVQGAGAQAYRAMQQGIRDAAMDRVQKGTREKVSSDEVNHKYCVNGVIGWSAGGNTIDVDGDSEAGALLNRFLRANPAVVSQLLDRVARLDGAASEARKR